MIKELQMPIGLPEMPENDIRGSYRTKNSELQKVRLNKEMLEAGAG